MNGTSFDGLDVALYHVSGSGLQTRLELKISVQLRMMIFKAQLKQIFSKRNIDLEQLCLLNEHYWFKTRFYDQWLPEALEYCKCRHWSYCQSWSNPFIMHHLLLHKQKVSQNFADRWCRSHSRKYRHYHDRWFQVKHCCWWEGAPTVCGDHILFGKKEDKFCLI